MDTTPNQRSCWPRVLCSVALIVLIGGAAFVWWEFYRTEELNLFAPLTDSDPYTFDVSTPVYLDDDCVGRVVYFASLDRRPVVTLQLKVTVAQRRKVKEGLKRVVGMRAVGLTTEFVDTAGVPLMNGDFVMPITNEERHLRRWARRLDRWLLPATGAGALFILRRLFRGRR